MAVKLTRSEVRLLKELKAAGEHGRRFAGASSAEIAHLIGAQYVKRLPGMKLHAITEGVGKYLQRRQLGKDESAIARKPQVSYLICNRRVSNGPATQSIAKDVSVRSRGDRLCRPWRCRRLLLHSGATLFAQQFL
jgi:hypothetical protein